MAWWPVAALAVGKVVFHLATSGIWGFHRDEFYYLAGGRHLAWGYVDHPPLTPALYRLGETVFGDSIVGLRVIPALIGGGLVVVGALLAREMGGRRFAQTLTALAACLGGLYLTPMHFLGTVTVDLLAWAVATLLVLRMIRTGDTRLWLAVGLVVGIGLLNKHSMLFWVAAVGIGLVLSPERRLLRSGWLLGGAAIALLLFFPNVVWQAQHDWATLHFLHNLQRRTSGEARAQFLPLQLGMATPAALVVWVVALRWMWRAPDGHQYRALAIAWAVLVVGLFLAGGKGYYAGSIYLPLVAIGAVVVERTWSAVGRRRIAAWVVVTGIVSAPFTMPLMPASALDTVPLDKVNADLSGMLGYRHLARQLGDVYHALPPAEQADAVVLTDSYSKAGAVDYWRNELRLPPAISGHNTYWLWGYDGADPQTTVIAAGLPESYLRRFFVRVDRVGTLGVGVRMDKEAKGQPIVVCHDPRLPWPQLWPKLKNYE